MCANAGLAEQGEPLDGQARLSRQRQIDAFPIEPFNEYMEQYRAPIRDKIAAIERIGKPSSINFTTWEIFQSENAVQARRQFFDDADLAATGLDVLEARATRARQEYRNKVKSLFAQGVALPESVWGEFRTESWVKKTPARLKISRQRNLT